MGKSSGGSPQIMMIPSQQSSTQTVSLPGWVDQAAQENLRMANDVSGRMPGPYSGQRVADMTPGQLSAIDAINNNVGSTSADFASARAIANSALAQASPAYESAFNLAYQSSNPASVQSAISGLQGSIGQSYTPIANVGTYNKVDDTGRNQEISFTGTPYANLNVGGFNFTPVDTGRNNFTQVSTQGAAYNPVNTSGVDYSPIGMSLGNFNPVDTSRTNYSQVDASGSGYDRINMSGPGFTPLVAGGDPTQQSREMLGQIYDPASGGVRSTAGAMDSIGAAYNPVYDTTGTAFNSLKGTIADARNLQGFTPESVSAQSLPQGNIADYINPYVDNVVNSSLRTLDRQRANTINQNADAAISQRAFGGSRQAMQDAITNAEFGSRAADLDANLRSQAFNQAQSALQADQARNLQAQLANQSAGIQGAGVRQGAAQLAADAASRLGSLGIDTGSFGVNAANTLGGLGLSNANFGLNAANTLGQLGLQNRAQNIDAQQANAGFGLQSRGQDITAGQANQSAALQDYQARQNAQQANIDAALRNTGQTQNAQQANAGMQLQDMAALRDAQQANAGLTMQNRGLLNDAQQTNINAALQNYQNILSGQQANAGFQLQDLNSLRNAQQANAQLGLQNLGMINDATLNNAQLAQNESQMSIGAQRDNAQLALQNRAQNLDAQQSNQNAALQAMQLEQQRQLQNANLGLQQQAQNQNAFNALGGLGIANSQLGYQGAGLLGNLGSQLSNIGLDTSRTLGDLAGAGQQAFLTGANAGLDTSALLQNQRQNEITGEQQAIADQRAALLDPIMLRLQALGQTPYGQTTTGSSMGLQGQMYQPTSSNPLLGLLGAGMTGLRAASGLGWQPLGR